MQYFLTEEFIDEIAKRVARKIAQKNYRNQLFKETRQPRIHVYESGCGNHDAFPTSNNGGCGSSSSYRYNGGCGSSSSYRYNGGCGSSSSYTSNGGCGSSSSYTSNGGCGSSNFRTGGC